MMKSCRCGTIVTGKIMPNVVAYCRQCGHFVHPVFMRYRVGWNGKYE